MNGEPQLRDLDDGYRFVASCRCGYRAGVDPAAVMAAEPEARFWTRAELAAHLRCSRCRRGLISDVRGEPDPGLLRRRLALERPARKPIAFQGGMVLP